jgi:mono/diheme cytochrome c family protein
VLRLAVLLLLVRSVCAAADARIERGRYLTHDVAMCVQCHTPRQEDGSLIEGKEFTGAPFPVTAPPFIASGEWCVVTPPIAGLPGFTKDEAVQFFMNGARLGSHQPKWPMPPFRMSRDDAEAVVAYLMSLPRREKDR